MRLDLAARPQRDGTFDSRSFRSARVITLEGLAIAPDPDTRERAKDRIAAVLGDGSRLAELSVDERTVTRRALVRLSAATKITDRSSATFDWSLQLTAPNPLRRGATENTATCGLPEPVSPEPTRHVVDLPAAADHPAATGHPAGIVVQARRTGGADGVRVAAVLLAPLSREAGGR